MSVSGLLTRKSLLTKVLFIWMLMAVPALSPPADKGPVNLGPKTVQANGIPTVDIGQIFGHLSNFASMLTQISQIRRQYQLVRDNLRTLSNITGWNALNDFFKPIDSFIQNNFDPIFAVSRLGYEGFKNLQKEYYEFQGGNDGNLSLSQQSQNAAKFTVQMFKDTFSEPAKAAEKIDGLQQKIQKANDCVSAAKGNKSMQHCLTHLKSLGVRQMSDIQRTIAKQTALIASRGLNDKVTRLHRQRAFDDIKRGVRNGTLDQLTNQPPNYTELPRRN